MNIWISKIAGTVLDWLFPQRCAVCDRALSITEIGLCSKCRPMLHKVEAPYCMKCGKPLGDESEILCDDCKIKAHSYERGRSVYLYDSAMKSSIYRFKYHGRKEYARFYAMQIAHHLSDFLNRIPNGVLIPIPLHEKRYEKRGYNQAALICRELSKLTGMPYREDVLFRTEDTKKQKELGVRERENNLKKAFKTYGNDVKLNTAILIDDIYTTGATIDAAARCLKESGVTYVYFVTLSIGRNT